MSTNVAGLVASAAQLALLQRAFIRPARSMGGLVAHVTLSERHTDTLEICEHPVERGAMIADHAYKAPAEVVIECGWSNTPQAAGVTLTGATVPMTVNEVYQQILRMQSELSLLTVLTGKRSYTNMLLRTVAVTTERNTENALLVTATFRQLILVGTKTLTLAPATGVSQASPGVTSPVLEAGTKQLTPAPFYSNPQAGP